MDARERAAATLAKRRQGVGLVLLAGLILLTALLRAHKGWVFPSGWWRF